MLELLKYEFRKKQGLLVGMFGVSAVFNIYLLTRTKVWLNGSTLASSALATFIMILILFSSDIKSLRNDLYKDTKYLTFSVPRSSRQYIGSKLLQSVIEYIITVLFGEIFLYSDILILLYNEKNKVTAVLTSLYWNISFKALVIGLLFYLGIQMLIYFSTIMRKGLFVTRKMGGLFSFIIFVLSAGLYFDIADIIMKFLRVYVNISIPYVYSVNDSISLSSIHMGNFTFGFNIVLLIYHIIFNVGLFFLITYALDREIDL